MNTRWLCEHNSMVAEDWYSKVEGNPTLSTLKAGELESLRIQVSDGVERNKVLVDELAKSSSASSSAPAASDFQGRVIRAPLVGRHTQPICVENPRFSIGQLIVHFWASWMQGVVTMPAKYGGNSGLARPGWYVGQIVATLGWYTGTFCGVEMSTFWYSIF